METTYRHEIVAQITAWSASRVTAAVKEAGADAVVASTVPNVFYLSGYSSLSHRLLGRVPVSVILTSRGTKHLLIPSSDCDLAAMHQPQVDTVDLYGTFYVNPSLVPEGVSGEEKYLSNLLPAMRGGSNWLSALEAVLGREHLDQGRILLDEEGLTAEQVDSLHEALPNVTFQSGSSLLKRARSVKSPPEVALLERASSITENAITTALQFTHEGSTDKDLHREFQSALIRQGAQPFFAVIGSGSRTCMSNVEPAGHPLGPNNVIRFDAGCKYMMYSSDIARNAVFGELSAKAQDYYGAILAGLEEGIEAMQPGLAASALFELMLETVRKNGIPHYERHHCGHGIGLEGYEPPLVAPHDGTVLKEGMVLCLETPYYEVGLGGLQVEDMVVVTQDGARSLTELDRHILAAG
jgi:Xaa-Pro aminopeptidase